MQHTEPNEKDYIQRWAENSNLNDDQVARLNQLWSWICDGGSLLRIWQHDAYSTELHRAIHRALRFDRGRQSAARFKLVELFGQGLPSGKIRIKRAPMSRQMSFLRFLCSRKRCDSIFEPIVADTQHEYFEALREDHAWHARWIRTRGSFWLCLLFVGQPVLSIMGWIDKFKRAS